MAYVYGNKVTKSGGNPWRTFISYSVSSTDTTTTLTVSMGMNPTDGWIQSGKRVYSLAGTGQTSLSKTESNVKVGNGTHTAKISATWSWSRGTSSASKTITAKTVYTGSNQDGTSTATLTVTVPARTYHSVSYSANGGSSTPATQYKYYGINITLASAISRTGYTFAGWKGSGATTATYSAGATYGVNSTTATTMTAQWTGNTYYVRFNANGGTGTMANESFSYGTAKALTSNAFTRTGYTFYGWATSSTGSRAYTNGQSVSNLTATNGGIVDLYAIWTVNTYTVQYNGNGNDDGQSAYTSSHTYGVAKNLTANAFTRTNYRFDGWATSSTGGVVYTDQQSVVNLTATNGATIQLYAVWTLEYIPPEYNQNSIKVYRSDSSGVLADEGAYGFVEFNYTNGQYPVGTTLQTVATAKYKEHDDTWADAIAITGTVSNNTFTAIFGGSLDIAKQYDVRLTLSDTVGGTNYAFNWDEFISTSVVTIDINAEGTAVSFFEPADDSKEGLFAPPMNSTELTNFLDSLNRDFRGSVDWIVEEGDSGIWHYRKWDSGVAECWGTYSNTISASTVSNGNYINYPFTFTEIPCITIGLSTGGADLYDAHIEQSGTTTTQVRLTMINRHTSSVAMKVNVDIKGGWK